MTIEQLSRAIELDVEALRQGGTFGVVRFRREPGPWVLRAATVLAQPYRGPSSFTSQPIPRWTLNVKEGSDGTIYEREWTLGALPLRDWSQQFSSNTLDVSVRVDPLPAIPVPNKATAIVWAEPGVAAGFTQWGALWVKPDPATAFLSIFGGEDLSIPRQAQALRVSPPINLDTGFGLLPFTLPAYVVQLGPDGLEVCRHEINALLQTQLVTLHYLARWVFVEAQLVNAGFGFPCEWVMHG